MQPPATVGKYPLSLALLLAQTHTAAEEEREEREESRQDKTGEGVAEEIRPQTAPLWVTSVMLNKL